MNRQAVRRYLPALALVLLAWALRLYRLDAQSLWYDEGYAVYTAQLGPSQTLLWSSRDFVPPLHAYLLALWFPLAGSTEFAARFPSAWAGVLAVIALAALGKDLYSRRAGLLSGLLAVFSPFYLWYSQEARMYMPQAALGLLATLALVRALRRPQRWRRWGGLALLDALALYAQATGAFLVAFHGLVILASGLGKEGRARLIRGGLALAISGLAWLPWLVYALPFLGENAGYWAGRLDWPFVFWGAFRGFVTGDAMGRAAGQLAMAAWGIASLAGLALLAFSTRRRWKTALLLLGYFAVPVAAMAWLFQSVPKFSPRYLIVASPPLFLLPGAGLAILLSRPGRWLTLRFLSAGLTLATLLATAGAGLANLYFSPAHARSDFRTAARMVREQIATGEAVLLVPGHTFPVWEYYFGSAGWLALPDDPILNVGNVLHYRNTVGPLNEWLTGRPGVWLVQWDPRVVDPTELVVSLLEQAGDEVPLAEEPTGLSLRHYRLLADRLPLPSDPPVSPPEEASLDLPLQLLGCHLPDTVRGDREVSLGCYWQATEALPHHLSVSARLVDRTGAEWGQADAPISGPDLVAGRWPLAEPVLGRYTVRPFPGIPPGDFYELQLVVYEPQGTVRGQATVSAPVVDRPSVPFTGTIPTSQIASVRLRNLVLEAAEIRPEWVLPGDEVRVEAIWRVDGPFEEPRLSLEGSAEEVLLLPEPGATDLWQIGDRYLTFTCVPISPYAPGGVTALRAVSGDGAVRLGTVRVDVTRTYTVPVGVEPKEYRLGDAISLVGAQLSIEPGEAGGTAEVVLYWRAEELVEQSYTVFVQVVGPDGQIYAQADERPQGGRHPTTHWLPGEVVADPYELTWSAEGPRGAYRLLAGLYHLATMERLPVTDAAGEPVWDDAIVIGGWDVP